MLDNLAWRRGASRIPRRARHATAIPAIIKVASVDVAGQPIAASSSAHCAHGWNRPRRNIATPAQHAAIRDPSSTENDNGLVVFGIEASIVLVKSACAAGAFIAIPTILQSLVSQAEHRTDVGENSVRGATA